MSIFGVVFPRNTTRVPRRNSSHWAHRLLFDSTSRMPEPVLTVIDTNVLLDWLVFDEPSVRALASAVTDGRLHWISTEAMRAEQRHVVCSLATSRWRAEPEVLESAYARWATMTDVPTIVGTPRCSDPDDQMFIDLALARRAPWLITRDRALLRLARRARSAGTEVITPQRWSALTIAPE